MGAPVPGWLRRILEVSREAVDAAGEAVTHEPGRKGGEDTWQ